MSVKKRKKRRLGSSVNGCHRRRAEAPNALWCWDFVFDRTTSGSQLKWLSVVDAYTRECLPLKVDRGITSEDVIDPQAELFAMRGMPGHIRSDNERDLIAQGLRRWLELVGVGTLYIEPGSPRENGYAESSYGRFRDGFLAMEIFKGVPDPLSPNASWRDEYNTQRPQSSLGYRTLDGLPVACAAFASAQAEYAACGEPPCS